MKIRFLGTGAHDYSKRLETEFKDKFDKDARRSSAMMIGDSLLVDCGDHLIDEMRIAGVDAAKITDIFNTHQHCDHYNIDHARIISEAAGGSVRLWVREGAPVKETAGVEVVYMKPFVRYEVRDGVFVTGMPANHEPKVFPQHLILEIDGKKLFYGCDGGWLLNETYGYMRKCRFDAMVLDCTVGDYAGDFRLGEHNSIPMIRLMLPSFKTTDIITEKTRIFLSHLAPSLHASHGETEKIAAKMGCTVAYDGLAAEI